MRKEFAEVEKKVEENIKEYGWHSFHVFDSPKFNYTIGLTESKNHPELIIFGLPPVAAHTIVSSLVNLITAKKPLPVDTKIEQVANMPLVLKSCEQRRVLAYTYWASGRYGDYGYNTLQVVWPDSFGNFPWDDDWNAKFDEVQPRLWNTN